MQVKVAFAAQCRLMEGLHWDARRNLLWFVDILGQTVFWFDPDTRNAGKRVLSEPVGWVLSIADSDRVLVGLKSGIALLNAFDEATPVEWLDRRFPGHVDQRLNDAKADKHGRLWYGSLSAVDQSQSVGRLARYEFDGSAAAIVDGGYQVTNGPAFNGDCSVMLHSDSRRRITYRYDMDAVTGATTQRAIWREFAEDEGSPDGMSFDGEGCVWIAHWGAAAVCRYDLHGNRLLAIAMPATNVTNVCFAGSELNRMFVSSASCDLNDAQQAAQPDAGALFEVTWTGIRGLPPWPWLFFNESTGSFLQ
jgi:D-xylonolactonase